MPRDTEAAPIIESDGAKSCLKQNIACDTSSNRYFQELLRERTNVPSTAECHGSMA